MIETERLKLRQWRDADALPFQVMCAHAEVMRYLGGPQSASAANALIARFNDMQASHGHCFWAVERKVDYAFLGFCGLAIADIAPSPVEGMVEIGWRLRRDAWGQGFAKEAAYACFDWGFTNLDCEEIIALTVSDNTRSWGLMDRLRMTRRPELDFTNPDDPAQTIITYARARGWG